MAKTPTESLIEFLKEGKVIPVIGAGVSAAVAGLPGWKRAIEHGFEFAEHRALNGDSIAKGKELLGLGNLTGSADILKRLLNSPKNPFATWLDELFGQPSIRDEVLLTNIHKLCCPMILTTNYDNLIFETLILGQKQLFDWSQFQEVHRAVGRKKEFILHLHGRAAKPETVILSSEDYQQLADQAGYKTVLQSLWMNYHFLFIGCSKDGVLDDDFITILNFLKQWFPSMPHQHFMLVNQQNINNGEHVSLLLDCNIEPITYGTDYRQLPFVIDRINPNKEMLEEKIKKLIQAHFEGNKGSGGYIEIILSRSKRYRALQQKLDNLKREFEYKKATRSYFDKVLYEQIGELEMLIMELKEQVVELVNKFPDLIARVGNGDIDEVIERLQSEDLDARAEQVRVEISKISRGKEAVDEKLRQLAQDYLLKAATVFMNVEDPDRAQRARHLVDKALAVFQDANILDEAARFYKIKLRLPEKGVAFIEQMLQLELDLVTRMVALYTLGTMYMAFDEASANKHLSKFCAIAENLKVNHPYLQTLYANGLHNLASSIVDDDEQQIVTYRLALGVRRTAAKADPMYLSSLVFTANMISKHYIETDKDILESTFDEAFGAMEAFLALEHTESVGFFEDNCLAGLIVMSLGFRFHGMQEKFDRLKGQFQVLLRKFDDYVVRFQPDHCLGSGEAYHQYFLTFSSNEDYPREQFQWMIHRSIVHLKQSMRYSLPNDRLYFMLTYSLTQKFLHKQLVEKDHLAAILLLKEALACCKKIKNPDDKAKYLLSQLTRMDEAECDCDDCQAARAAWNEMGIE